MDLPFLRRFVGYQLEGYFAKFLLKRGCYVSLFRLKIAYQNALLSYISRFESRRKLPPGKEKNGLQFAARRCDAEWVLSQIIDACRAAFYS